MIINGYKVNFEESELDDILNSKTRIIEFISPDFEGYEKLSENDKKALLHLVKAAKTLGGTAKLISGRTYAFVPDK